ncbi:Transposase and inactivated derivatives [Bacillus sp. 166amftsu]|nr:Transposase and inactivated derivatives [Bacillus sp. 166amftsu]
MSKFSSKEKLQIVKQYFDGVDGGKRIAKSLGIHSSIIYQWIKQYEAFGEKAFEKRYTTYSLQYKLDVLNYMEKQGTSMRETAAIFNIPSHEIIRRWRVAYDSNGVDALRSKKKGRPAMKNKKAKIQPKQDQVLAEGSIEALQAENERLRMENDYLKKLNALVQKKNKSQIKTERK